MQFPPDAITVYGMNYGGTFPINDGKPITILSIWASKSADSDEYDIAYCTGSFRYFLIKKARDTTTVNQNTVCDNGTFFISGHEGEGTLAAAITYLPYDINATTSPIIQKEVYGLLPQMIIIFLLCMAFMLYFFQIKNPWKSSQ